MFEGLNVTSITVLMPLLVAQIKTFAIKVQAQNLSERRMLLSKKFWLAYFKNLNLLLTLNVMDGAQWRNQRFEPGGKLS